MLNAATTKEKIRGLMCRLIKVVSPTKCGNWVVKREATINPKAAIPAIIPIAAMNEGIFPSPTLKRVPAAHPPAITMPIPKSIPPKNVMGIKALTVSLRSPIPMKKLNNTADAITRVRKMIILSFLRKEIKLLTAAEKQS